MTEYRAGKSVTPLQNRRSSKHVRWKKAGMNYKSKQKSWERAFLCEQYCIIMSFYVGSEDTTKIIIKKVTDIVQGLSTRSKFCDI